mgnify:CR=1 FL=1
MGLISRKGYTLMIVGMCIYFFMTLFSFAFTPEFDNIDDYMNYSKLIGLMSFIGVLMFMYGSIIEVRSLWDTMDHPKKISMMPIKLVGPPTILENELYGDNETEVPTLKHRLIRVILIIIAIWLALLLFAVFFVWG